MVNEVRTVSRRVMTVASFLQIEEKIVVSWGL